MAQCGYVLTKGNRLITVWGHEGCNIWLHTRDKTYEFSCRNCKCDPCTNHSHQHCIQKFERDAVISAGFHKPAVAEGRLLTWQERDALRDTVAWFKDHQKKGFRGSFKKLLYHIPRLETLLELCSKSS